MPAAIRQAILAAASGAREIGDRREAIAAAIAASGPDDVVLIAGKGHEQGQIVGDAGAAVRRCPGGAGVRAVTPAVDRRRNCRRHWRHGAWRLRRQRRHLRQPRGHRRRAVPRAEGRRHRRPPLPATGHRSRGRRRCRVRAGRSSARPRRRHHAGAGRPRRALPATGRRALRIGVTGSVGKTGVKEAIRASLTRFAPDAVHASVKSYNNHTGVPLSLSRMPRDTRFGIFEMGMNHSRRDRRADAAGAAAHRRHHLGCLGPYRELSPMKRALPTPRARFSAG